MKPVYVEVITKVLMTFGHDRRSELFFDRRDFSRKIQHRDINEYPEEVRDEFLRLCDWVRELARLYKHRILIRVIDAHSPMGILKYSNPFDTGHGNTRPLSWKARTHTWDGMPKGLRPSSTGIFEEGRSGRDGLRQST